MKSRRLWAKPFVIVARNARYAVKMSSFCGLKSLSCYRSTHCATCDTAQTAGKNRCTPRQLRQNIRQQTTQQVFLVKSTEWPAAHTTKSNNHGRHTCTNEEKKEKFVSAFLLK